MLANESHEADWIRRLQGRYDGRAQNGVTDHRGCRNQKNALPFRRRKKDHSALHQRTRSFASANMIVVRGPAVILEVRGAWFVGQPSSLRHEARGSWGGRHPEGASE